jgi:hypothetical protein
MAWRSSGPLAKSVTWTFFINRVGEDLVGRVSAPLN